MLIVFCELSTKTIVEQPLEGAENIIDILDADPNPTDCILTLHFLKFLFLDTVFPNACMIFFVLPFYYQGESEDVSFKAELAYVSLLLRSQCFPTIEQIPSFGKDLFDSKLRLDCS